MTSTAAILLAGGRIKAKDRAEWQSLLPSGSDNRVMVDIAGKPMYRYVIDAIRGADIQLVIAGDVPFDGNHIRVDGGDSLVDTLLNGIAALPPAVSQVLVVTADIPFLTSAGIAAILQSAPNADFVYTIIPMDTCRAAFPDAKRTSLKTADGELIGAQRVDSQATFDGRVYRVYVLLRYPLAQNNSLRKEREGAQSKRESDLRAARAQQDLERETQRQRDQAEAADRRLKEEIGPRSDAPAPAAAPTTAQTVNTSEGPVKLLDVDNVEYKQKRADALAKPGAVIGQTVVR